MKKYLAILVAASAVLFSCSKMEGDVMPGDYDHYNQHGAQSEDISGVFNAIVTVKKTPTDSVYFQINDSETIYPANYQSKYTRMERIICCVNASSRPTGRFNYTCNVEWAEPIEEGLVTDSAVGRDPIDIIDDWMTSVEDGYLTLHYNALWGNTPTIHSFSIVTGTSSDNPYVLVLRHDAKGDAQDWAGDGLVCCDINSLPDTEGQYKELTLKWNNLEGSASERQFKFKTRE